LTANRPATKRPRPRTIRRIAALIALLVVAGVIIAGALWFQRGLAAPIPGAPSSYLRIEEETSLKTLLRRFANNRIIRDVKVAELYAWFTHARRSITPGTYRIGPGMSLPRVLFQISNPIHQKVRLSDGRWASRTAQLLARWLVCPATDYVALTKSPKAFKAGVDFPLPDTSLEGYLYPDTYDLPPLLGAKGTIQRQLKAFQTKVFDKLGHPAGLQRAVIVASLIELEVSRDEERPLVSAVIANRLERNMPLQIDASLNYALGQWRPLRRTEYHSVPGPYNLYLHPGLPPGPICSPSVKSIEAALHPAPVDYLYYVALPGGQTLFAKTYPEHLANLKTREQALAARRHAVGQVGALP
jgi:UPF0755 protein